MAETIDIAKPKTAAESVTDAIYAEATTAHTVQVKQDSTGFYSILLIAFLIQLSFTKMSQIRFKQRFPTSRYS